MSGVEKKSNIESTVERFILIMPSYRSNNGGGPCAILVLRPVVHSAHVQLVAWECASLDRTMAADLVLFSCQVIDLPVVGSSRCCRCRLLLPSTTQIGTWRALISGSDGIRSCLFVSLAHSALQESATQNYVFC